MSSLHGPIIPYKLSAEELAEYDRKLGKPTKPLNYYKGRVYSSPPKEESKPAPKKQSEAKHSKTCSMDGCKQRYWAKGYCQQHYNKAKGMGII